MDKFIVYVDDAAHAQQLIAPLAASRPVGKSHWVLVACAPRMTHRVSKWVSHSARESWRTKWADKLFAQLIPGAGLPPSQVTTVLAKIPLAELTEQLQVQAHSASGHPATVLDARKPRLANEAPAVTDNRPEGPQALSRWPQALGSVLTGCSTLWALALD